jgi:hypothetical protein
LPSSLSLNAFIILSSNGGSEIDKDTYKMSEIKGFDKMFRLDGKVALVTGGKRNFPSSAQSLRETRVGRFPDGVVLQVLEVLGYIPLQHSFSPAQEKYLFRPGKLVAHRALTKQLKS